MREAGRYVSARVANAERCGRAAGRGALGGLIASVPALGSGLAALCAACFGGGAAAGFGIGLARWPFVAAGVAVLLMSGWLSDRRGRHHLPPRQRVRSFAVTLAVAGTTAAATYLLVNVALVTVIRIAAEELAGAFAH